MHRNKASGLDGLCAELFIVAGTNISSHISLLFNYIYNSGHYPDAWCVGFIVPIHKKGPTRIANNFRGITILSAFGKPFSTILNTRILNWCEAFGVITESQAGFRPLYSTSDQLFVLQAVIEHILKTKNKLYVAFIDFSKAFDLVERSILLTQLMYNGLSGKILQIIKSMYTITKTCLKYAGTYSSFFNCNVGVRQGECLSPILFILFINDMEEQMSRNFEGIDMGTLKLMLLLYADDTVIFGDSPDNLQAGLNAMTDFCRDRKITINHEKTKIMIFEKRQHVPDFIWTLDGNNLEVVSEFKYLGLNFGKTGKYNPAFKSLATQATKASFMLRKHMLRFPNLPVNFALQFFDSMVVPVLSYGCQLWGFKEVKSLEVIHKKFCKMLLGVKQSTPDCFVYGELGRFPLYIKWQVAIIKFWLNILRSKRQKYTFIMYQKMVDATNHNNNVINWASQVRDLLNNLGYGQVWLDQAVFNENWLIRSIEQRLKDQYMQSWLNFIDNSSKATLYKSFKNTFSIESYLITLPKHLRMGLSRLRCSSHDLHIETGRWARPPVPQADRTCTHCHLNAIEDEYHFLLICPKYSNIRATYIEQKFWQRPSKYKFQLLMSRKFESVAKYIFQVNRTR